MAWFIAVRDSVPLTAKPWHRPAASLACPQCEEFSIRINLIVVLGRKTSRDDHGIAEAHQRHAHRAAKQRLKELRVERSASEEAGVRHAHRPPRPRLRLEVPWSSLRQPPPQRPAMDRAIVASSRLLSNHHGDRQQPYREGR